MHGGSKGKAAHRQVGIVLLQVTDLGRVRDTARRCRRARRLGLRLLQLPLKLVELLLGPLVRRRFVLGLLDPLGKKSVVLGHLLRLLLAAEEKLGVLPLEGEDGVLVRANIALLRRDLFLGGGELLGDAAVKLGGSLDLLLLLVGELVQDGVLVLEGVDLPHRCEVVVVRLCFLRVGELSVLGKMSAWSASRTSALKRCSFSSITARLNTLDAFCSSSVAHAVESRSISP